MSEQDDGNGAMSSDGPLDSAALREAAIKSLKRKAQFKDYLLVWLGVSVLQTVIWWLTGGWGTYFWPAWGIFGMGIAAFFIGIDAYSPGRRPYSEDRVQAEIDKLRGRPRP